ncbi:MAG: hypothetical protein EXS13_13775 [Planctomycetes bacterium]|nr:hypothetical protein [Planctomycetota bacterium]
MTSSAWDPTERIEAERLRSVAPPQSALAQLRRDLADHKAWWILPMLVTLAVLSLLLFMARGDVTVPAIYRLF